MSSLFYHLNIIVFKKMFYLFIIFHFHIWSEASFDIHIIFICSGQFLQS